LVELLLQDRLLLSDFGLDELVGLPLDLCTHLGHVKFWRGLGWSLLLQLRLNCSLNLLPSLIFLVLLFDFLLESLLSLRDLQDLLVCLHDA